MASLENRTGYYNVVFRFAGQKFTRSLETQDETEALTCKLNLERTLREVKEGRRKIPDDADISTFLLSNGELIRPLEPPP